MTYPEEFGAQRGSRYEAIYEAILSGFGSAFSNDTDGYIAAEAMAAARAIDAFWGEVNRLALQSDPDRMTDFLPRWESILGLPSTGSDIERRARVRAKRELVGQAPTVQMIRDLCVTILGDVFIGVLHTAAIDSVGACNGGAAIPGGPTLSDGSWCGSTAYLGIKVTQPSGYTDGDFYQAVGDIYPWLDDVLPAWADYAPIVTPGFKLDSPDNLNWAYFTE